LQLASRTLAPTAAIVIRCAENLNNALSYARAAGVAAKPD
jgi:hypothetical protein